MKCNTHGKKNKIENERQYNCFSCLSCLSWIVKTSLPISDISFIRSNLVPTERISPIYFWGRVWIWIWFFLNIVLQQHYQENSSKIQIHHLLRCIGYILSYKYLYILLINIIQLLLVIFTEIFFPSISKWLIVYLVILCFITVLISTVFCKLRSKYFFICFLSQCIEISQQFILKSMIVIKAHNQNHQWLFNDCIQEMEQKRCGKAHGLNKEECKLYVLRSDSVRSDKNSSVY